MDAAQPPWLLATLITSICFSALCASACWIAVLRCSQMVRSLRALIATPPSETKLAALSADQAELFSTLEKLTTTVKRLSSRSGMQQLRERDPGPPPPGASKAEVRRYYGFTHDGPEFAKHQLQLVPKE